MSERKRGLYVQLYNIHGLLKSKDLELGRDIDTGGQTKYVLEFAKSLSEWDSIEKIEIMTRYIADKSVSEIYSQKIEKVNDKVDIIRIRCGGTKYIRKEMLWDYLEEFVDKTIKYLKTQERLPDLIHSHYADAGYVCTQLTRFFGIPFIHTGHSLGRPKKDSLLNNNFSIEEIEKRYNISKRIKAEELTIFYADKIITSTNAEIKNQYGIYENFSEEKFSVIPPSISLEKFYAFNLKREWTPDEKVIRFSLQEELWRFFTNLNKPIILALCRPEKVKNIGGLIQAYGESKELQEKANLAIYAGIRKDIKEMPDLAREVLTDMLLLMDKYNLYGKMAIPKTNFENEIPELYRLAAESSGVFVNSAFTENFGITLIESAASGLPIVATDDGGPRDIVKNLNNGILVDVKEPKNISDAILKILDDNNLWKKYSQNGVSTVEKYYSWKAHTNMYLEFVNNIFEKRKIVPKTFIETGRKFLNYKKLIILDIDETITGNEKAIESLKNLLINKSANIGFGVATGRTIESAIKILKEIKFVMPDVIISSVGSEIYYKSGDEYEYSTSWAAHIQSSWKPRKIRELLDRLSFLELQPKENQREFKVSYNLIGKKDDIKKAVDLIRVNKIKTNLIISHDVYIDLLPFRASKGRAIRYLSYRWNIPLDSILVGGDSGNDEDMLTGELLGVVVGNHTKELDKLKGRRRIYFAENKNAAGIIEGIEYYKFMENKERLDNE
ncbi:MAG: HAD-IIB family hydrolase [Ignavibacteriales bacterium]|nr:HAD-IIB family hydrolase [Ignavibacteriales bacterium]MCB9209903.1 HAD-IIB family hydrolase [Ignavibacteriales bacterium]MCB9260269.1 HAD-IIB family hydrolase [Ignavibacteriales bacterium]